MVSGGRRKSKDGESYRPDEVDLRIMHVLADDGGLTYKEIAERLDLDKRTVAKRAETLKKSGALRITAEIDWPSIGVNALAFVGTMTALGEEDVAKLYDYIKREPRVIEAYSTLGSDEYFLTVLDTDLRALREEVLRKLEPLTADLSTAIVSTRIKSRGHAAFLSFLLERDGPKRPSDGRDVSR